MELFNVQMFLFTCCIASPMPNEAFLSPLRSQTLSIYITASGSDIKTHIHIKHVKPASPNSTSTLDYHALATDRELNTNFNETDNRSFSASTKMTLLRLVKA
jgi:hypothetical protein